MTSKRAFEVVGAYEGLGIHLPKRATKASAGYDIEAAETITVPSYWKTAVAMASVKEEIDSEVLKPTLVPTGLKCRLPEDEYLQLISRSSNPLKRRLMLPNSVGIIDSDYYNNPNNEGHIYVQLINFGLEDVVIEKGERIAQGIFTKYLTIENEQEELKERTGGFGSSGK